MEHPWYFIFTDKRLFTVRFAYWDVKEHVADRLFINQKVTVNFKDGDMVKCGERYVLTIAKCKKRDLNSVTTALEHLPATMLILGYNDYESFCEKMYDDINSVRKEGLTSNGSNI